jgi:hypothetical protein
VYLYISLAAVDRWWLGTVNGLTQTMASVQCTIRPAAADSLVALSITHNILGGDFVYVVLVSIVCIALYITVKFPRHVWTYSSR